MKKLFLTLAFFVFVSSLFAKETVRIGVIFPLSGANADKGEANLAAVKMAVEEIPKDSKFNYELFFEDDQGDAKRAATAVQKLINVNKVDALMSYYAPSGNVVSSMAEKHKVLHFGITTDENVAKGAYNFIYFFMSEDMGRKWAEAFNKEGYKRISVITQNQLGCLGVFKAFEKAAKTYDLEIVQNQIINPGEKDYRSFISKATETKPDAYLIYAVAPEIDLILNQFRQMKVKGFYTGLLDLTEETKAAENIWYVSMSEPDKDFQKRFEEKTKKRMLYGVPAAFDDICLMVKTFEAAPTSQKPPSKWVIDYINSHAGEFRGVAGSFKYDKDLGYFRLEPGINVIRKGLVEEYSK